jgi:hypothetical protein
LFTAGFNYGNDVNGPKPIDGENDKEGIGTMKQLGQNSAWFVKKTFKQYVSG